LDADESEKPEAAIVSEAPQQRWNVDACVGLVDRLDVDGDIRAEHVSICAIRGDAIQRGK
jgi:hypothetical protein